MLYVIGGQKGGTGKSTIATNLAVALTHASRQVVLVDTDRQQTATHWSAEREQDGSLPQITCIQKTGKLFSTLKDLEKRYQDVIVDAGGFDSVELRSALPAADALYSPVRASQSDLWTLEAVDQLVSEAQDMNPALEAFLVLSMVPTNPRIKETLDARTLLTDYERFTVCQTAFADRKAFRDAMVRGRGVVELDDPKAKNEVLSFMKEVRTHGVQETVAAAS